jgi:hypothetical protein
MSTEALTRESRYEGRWHLECTIGETEVPGGTFMAGKHGPELPLVVPIQGSIEFTRCRSCGSLVAVGSEDLHERLHPRLGCNQTGCGVFHFDGHAWEEQFGASTGPAG